MSSIGKNIKKIRTTKGLNQTEFGKLFGLTRGSIGSYEEGRAEPKIDTLLQIAKKFSITLDDITTKDLTVNQLSGFNPDTLVKSNTLVTQILKPMISSTDLIESKGDYRKCKGIGVFDLQGLGKECLFLIQLDSDVKVNGAITNEKTILFCGSSAIENELGSIEVQAGKLIWDVENSSVGASGFAVCGIISSSFKRVPSNTKDRMDAIEARLKAVEKQLK